MKITLSQGIETMSGKSNGVLFKTYNRPNGKKETRAYILPVKDVSPTGKKTYGYKRQAALSENEIGVRNKFTIVSRQIKNLTDEQRQLYAKEWKAAKYKFNGKKYVTLRGYIMARLYAENAKK
jgi:hypothetical protein